MIIAALLKYNLEYLPDAGQTASRFDIVILEKPLITLSHSLA